jgi:hypothetical protein
MRHLALVKANGNHAGVEPEALRKGRVSEDMLKCSYRPPDADFYCWRFKIWYNTLDCAYRTRHLTFPGCARCAQGEFNLQSRRADLHRDPTLGDRRR